MGQGPFRATVILDVPELLARCRTAPASSHCRIATRNSRNLRISRSVAIRNDCIRGRNSSERYPCANRLVDPVRGDLGNFPRTLPCFLSNGFRRNADRAGSSYRESRHARSRRLVYRWSIIWEKAYRVSRSMNQPGTWPERTGW